MSVYEIPLSPQPEQFTISLAGVTYQLTTSWNQWGQYWVLDIADATGNRILAGTAMLPGRDLLQQYKHLGIGGALFVQSDHDPLALPTYDNLGLNSHLYFAPYQ